MYELPHETPNELPHEKAHGIPAAGRASMPTQEKKNVITTVKDVDN